jgi:hypothetical protein
MRLIVHALTIDADKDVPDLQPGAVSRARARQAAHDMHLPAGISARTEMCEPNPKTKIRCSGLGWSLRCGTLRLFRLHACCLLLHTARFRTRLNRQQIVAARCAPLEAVAILRLRWCSRGHQAVLLQHPPFFVLPLAVAWFVGFCLRFCRFLSRLFAQHSAVSVHLQAQVLRVDGLLGRAALSESRRPLV